MKAKMLILHRTWGFDGGCLRNCWKCVELLKAQEYTWKHFVNMKVTCSWGMVSYENERYLQSIIIKAGSMPLWMPLKCRVLNLSTWIQQTLLLQQVPCNTLIYPQTLRTTVAKRLEQVYIPITKCKVFLAYMSWNNVLASLSSSEKYFFPSPQHPRRSKEFLVDSENALLYGVWFYPLVCTYMYFNLSNIKRILSLFIKMY